MMRWIGPIAVLAVSAPAAHWATLAYAPSVIMDRALQTLKDRGIAEHAFTSPVRITPDTQVVVRSSPDLFYSLCRYDLSEPSASLLIRMAQWPDYQSLSFFDAETNNYFTQRGTGESVEVTLVGPGNSASGTVTSPSTRGVILIRRLAPSQELFDQAKALASDDSCTLKAP